MDAELRERALAKLHLAKQEVLTRGSKPLPKLSVGDSVMIQDQTTHKAGRWTKTGTIVEDQGFDSYTIKVDESNNVTKRNRKFLRLIIPYIDTADKKPQSSPVSKAPPPTQSSQTPKPKCPEAPVIHPIPSQPTNPLPIQPVQEPVQEPVQDPVQDRVPDPVPDHVHHPLPIPLVQDIPAPTSKPAKKYLPPHLRHKWIVNSKLVKSGRNLSNVIPL